MDKRTMSFDDFRNHCNIIFNNKYDYSNSNYIGMKHKLNIICPIHGEFTQKAQSHYRGHHCSKCSGNSKIQNSEIIKHFEDKHGKKYDYRNVVYKGNRNPVEIICEKHGIFNQSPYEHKRGNGCPKCAKNRRLNVDIFVESSNIIHDNIYSYNNVVFLDSRSKVMVTCKNHGDFPISPNHHLRGRGCPNCKKSFGEMRILNYLKIKDIDYVQQKYFKNLVNIAGKYLFFDFYLPQINICIEYDGQQHFGPISKFGGINAFEKLALHDSIKNEFCQKNNIKIIRIKYTNFNEIEKILDDEIFPVSG